MKQILALAFSTGFFFLLSSYTGKTGHFIKARDIEKQFAQISNNILLGKYEVSNAEYRKFLEYLVQAKQEALYKQCLLDTAKWDATSSVSLKAKYHTLKTFEGYPVVTVSYESANEYCKWLTERYNLEKGRKYRKVLFRLPTEQEWTYAASGGTRQKMYPWGNFYLRNNKGEYLCNFLHVGDQAITFDQATKTYKVVEQAAGINDRAMPFAPVDAFYPSPAGLYNLSGNAAEMVAEKGLAKGGSYKDPGYDVTIASKKYYSASSPEVGFRVLMEVVDR